jgi:hypothetical protein
MKNNTPSEQSNDRTKDNTPNTHIHDLSISRLPSYTSITSGGVNPVLNA